ncbi:MAG: hypothetical protein OJF50_004459 [Nitrospira sp.]|nr:hypothetical protein [Nitrospira sp.]
MHSQLRRLINGLGIFTIGIVLSVSHPRTAQATDLIDPATQPHLKSWSNVIPVSKRFIVLLDFNNSAVLDRETGLVWEKTLDGAATLTWSDATSRCLKRNVGTRKGWRLPSVAELGSLIDPSVPFSAAPTLPAGHPFENVALAGYWSATTVADVPGSAWVVWFDSGSVDPDAKTMAGRRAWCVRGPMNADVY